MRYQFKHTDDWNEQTPIEERMRLAPYMIETHILHLEQFKEAAVRNHNRLIGEINDHIRNLRASLSRKESRES